MSPPLDRSFLLCSEGQSSGDCALNAQYGWHSIIPVFQMLQTSIVHGRRVSVTLGACQSTDVINCAESLTFY